MALLRFLAWVFLLATGAVLVRDGLVWLSAQLFAPLSLGGLWSELGFASEMATHHALDHVSPLLWSFGLAPVLSLWAAPAFFVLAVVLFLVARALRPRRFY